MIEREPLYREIGMGVVVKDMFPGDAGCYVHLLEQGIGKTDIADLKTAQLKIDTLEGEEVTLDNLAGSTIYCTWFPRNVGYTETPPVLGKGAVVTVYRRRRDGAYFWEPFGTVQAFTKRVLAKWLFPARREKPGANELKSGEKGYDPKVTGDYWNSCYEFIVDTFSGYVGLHTTMLAGEAAAYRLVLNTKHGVLQIIDNNGNGVEFLSKLAIVKIRSGNDFGLRVGGTANVDIKKGLNVIVAGDTMSRIKGAFVQEVKGSTALKFKDLYIESEGIAILNKKDVQLKNKGKIEIQSEGDLSYSTNSGNIDIFTTGTTTVTSTGGFNITTPTLGVNGVLSGQALSLGGGASGAPAPKLVTIEPVDFSVLDTVEDFVIKFNKNAKENKQKDKEQKEEKKEEEEKVEIEDPEQPQEEEVEQKSVSNVKGEITFNTESTFKVAAKGGLSLVGGSMNYDIVECLNELCTNINDAISGRSSLVIVAPPTGGTCAVTDPEGINQALVLEALKQKIESLKPTTRSMRTMKAKVESINNNEVSKVILGSNDIEISKPIFMK